MDFLLDGRALVKARLGESHFIVYVRTGDEFESVVRLSAYRETQPALDSLLSDLEPHVERAVERPS